MTALTRMRKMWRPVLIGVMVLAGLATAAPPASAATTNRTGICNKGGGYNAYLEFPHRGMTSFGVRPGTCWSKTLAAGSYEPVKVWAVSSGSWRLLGETWIHSGNHNVFRTSGSGAWGAYYWYSTN
ncbi:hypothetical protein ACFY2R_27060 [Micromonospora olivasterospora]|uniref:Uncharacterized protein n=1 Tax=Micromonospora olivasterospora TaxID=1880 RepID=A0A562ICW3_MICOL|nr:hypothetical protein [Micromonospora olivasterospora]TWH68827.1 hypothetical protein JD77_03828 [Micromonospora olivasterospora]